MYYLVYFFDNANKRCQESSLKRVLFIDMPILELTKTKIIETFFLSKFIAGFFSKYSYDCHKSSKFLLLGNSDIDKALKITTITCIIDHIDFGCFKFWITTLYETPPRTRDDSSISFMFIRFSGKNCKVWSCWHICYNFLTKNFLYSLELN